MPRSARSIPNVKIRISFSAELAVKLTASLYSEVEGRVPKGAYQSLFEQLLREHFSSRTFDLAPFSGSPPGIFYVRGAPSAIIVLEKALKGEIPA
jgi:hypothetical protein